MSDLCLRAPWRPALAPLALVVHLLPACAEGPEADRARGLLVGTDRREDWAPAPALGPDPFADRGVGATDCPPTAWFIEADGIEIDTGLCSFVTLQQPTRLDLRRGDELRVLLYHFDLTSPTPGEGLAGIAVGDTALWTLPVTIPGPAGFHDERVLVEQDAHAGSPLSFHIDNHGQNTWKLVEVALNP